MDTKRILGFIGFGAFIIGAVLAIAAGIAWPTNQAIVVALVVLGAIIGFLNVSAKDFMPLLLATVALVVVGNAFEPLTTLHVGEILGNVLSRIGVLVAPAAVIVAIKALWTAANPKEG